METFRIFALLSVLVVMLSCSSNKSANGGKVRPGSVPDSAFWVGGVDGGHWYLVKSVDLHQDGAFITIYGDSTGEVWESKHFKMVCPSEEPRLTTNLREEISAFDGRRILLRSVNGRAQCFLQ